MNGSYIDYRVPFAPEFLFERIVLFIIDNPTFIK